MHLTGKKAISVPLVFGNTSPVKIYRQKPSIHPCNLVFHFQSDQMALGRVSSQTNTACVTTLYTATRNRLFSNHASTVFIILIVRTLLGACLNRRKSLTFFGGTVFLFRTRLIFFEDEVGIYFH